MPERAARSFEKTFFLGADGVMDCTWILRRIFNELNMVKGVFNNPIFVGIWSVGLLPALGPRACVRARAPTAADARVGLEESCDS